MTQIMAGSYQAKIVNYGIFETKKGDLKVFVECQIPTEDGRIHKLTWNSGFYSPSNTEITLKALMACGLKDHSQVELMADGPASGVLSTALPISVTVEYEADYKDSSKSYPVIKWINAFGEGPKSNADYKVNRETARRKLASISLGAAMISLREKQAQEAAKNGQAPAQPQRAPGNLSDIPF